MTASPGPVGSPGFGRSSLGKGGLAAAGATLAGTALTALSHAPDRLQGVFGRRFPLVAVTGMTGVGKSALADRLARRSSPDGGEEVGSAVMERRTRRGRRLRGFRFRVVPGDNAATRLGALDEVFHDEPVDGVLHVVSWGHATPRRRAGTTGTAVATRDELMAAELEDWIITAHRIASLAVRRDRPIWLVIAVTKTDLFPDQVDEAVDYYSPGSGSPFGDRVDELRSLAGGARLSIDVLPVCAQGDERRAPRPGRASTKECTRLLDRLETRLRQLSGHV